MNNITWQYIAGFFDGEGTIFYTTTWAKNRKTGKRTYKCKRIAVAVAQSLPQKKVILEIAEFLRKQKIGFSFVKSKKHIPYLRLDIGVRGEQISFLKEVLPYLIVKKEKAVDGLKFLEERNKVIKGNFTIREKEKIVEMRKNKKTYKEIGKEIGRHQGNIAQFFCNLKKKKYAK